MTLYLQSSWSLLVEILQGSFQLTETFQGRSCTFCFIFQKITIVRCSIYRQFEFDLNFKVSLKVLTSNAIYHSNRKAVVKLSDL